ncbi:cytochrome P450 4C1 [Ooceraea biroi]|uniref:cytochrome P450 4C1 n=1 Tax=Ooceraea biroi TaxID=2015173 RepID=UPI000F08F8DE|nr:cytochrome P450 4C1 [Ooceraea biroi]
MITSVLLSCAVFAFLYYYVIHLARFRRLINLIPGPPMFPIIGDIGSMTFTSTEQFLELIVARFKKYNCLYKIWLFMIAYIIISHPDDIQTLVNSTRNNEKGMAYTLLHSWLGDGLLLSKGAKWQERRKILTPAFHFHILKRFFDILIEESNHMAKSLKDIKSSTVEDLASVVSHHTLNIISETSMGISLRNVSTLEQQQYRETIHELGETLFYRVMRPWYYSDMIFTMSPRYKNEITCLKILHEFTEKVIKERKQYHESTNGRFLNFEKAEEDEEIIGGGKKRLAMLDLLIAASKDTNLSDLDIREEVDTFMFEGHDTVAMALTFAILLLAEHKDAQDRVRDEVNAVMEENGGKLTMAALQNLTYLERCLKETMRLYPSVFFILRKLTEDVKMQSYLVPGGTQVYIDILHLHKNPEFWPNPEIFDPDRFLPELVQDRHPFAYVPFSAGSRNCIGQRFAMMEMKVVVATLVHNFYLESMQRLADVRVTCNILLRPAERLRVKFVPI